VQTTKPEALLWAVDNCTVTRAMTILGERWALVVLREIVNGVRRFEDMREHTDIPRQVLTNRLAMLVHEGILRRVPYQEPGERARNEYRLTDKGFDLYPVLVAVWQWGDRYLADPEGSPVEMAHRDCGALLGVHMRCEAGHELHAPREVVTRPGRGARRRGEQ
jgi:DNA-binding HxlR family transcriptional regulator